MAAAADRDTVSPLGASSEWAEAVRDDELDALFSPLSAYHLAILAVSGGADSIAMLHLAVRWRNGRDDPAPKLIIATVDHGLRANAREEADWVARQSAALGLEHATLTWSGDKPATGIQEAARQARYRLLAEHACTLAPSGRVAIVTAHTEDDQAETLLMRLARGSGVDGLAGMASTRSIGGDGLVTLLRPLLAVSGARLRATLRQAGTAWIEDPSNEAERFERVRLRKARALLAGAGLDNDKLALSARRLARARTALDAAAVDLGRTARLDLHAGAFASFERPIWLAAPEETRLRLLAQLIAAYGGQSEPLRLARLEALVERLGQAAFEGATLAGAIIAPHGDYIRVQRELGRAALPSLTLDSGTSAVWDGRFRVGAAPASSAPVIVRALGTDAYARLRQQIRVADVPASAAATLPAFWRGEELVLVPYFAGHPGASPGWTSVARLYSAEFIG